MREFTAPPLEAVPQAGGLADSVFERADRYPGHVALSRKDAAGQWRDVTTAQFRDEVLALAKGLLAEGVRFGDRVAIMSRTRYEWTLFDYALWTVGAQSVPVHPTASSEQVVWMFTDADVTAAVVETEDHAMTIGAVIGELPLLKRLWQLDAGAEAQLVAAGERIDASIVHRHRMALTPDTVATVSYTSGTDGRPKGCVLTHSRFMSECDAVAAHCAPLFRSGPKLKPATLLFLPLAHVHGRVAQVTAVRTGVRLGHHPEPDVDSLMAALRSFRPTCLVATPHLFEKIFDATRRVAETAGMGDGFEGAVDIAVRYAEASERRVFDEGPGPGTRLKVQHQLMDRLFYGKLREALGGRLRHAVSGGSSMDRRLALFFDGAGVRVSEGYGLTESTSALTTNPPGRTRFGTVGTPIPGTRVRIADDGEVWVRGGQVFTGYLRDQAATAKALRDGWLATGDLGSLSEDGYLTLIGRKEDVLVGSDGTTLSPGLLEARVRCHPLVSQCVVVGNGRRFFSALVTLDPEAVDHWLAMRHKPLPTPEELVDDSELEDEIRRAVVGANTLVSRAQSIRTFRILGHRFTEEQGLLTPSLKLRRRAIEEEYEQEIDALYRSGESSG